MDAIRLPRREDASSPAILSPPRALDARLEARDMVGLQLGHCFSALTPNGDFRDVPVDPERYGIDESIAQELIQLIRSGQPLPNRLIRMLPEI